MTQLTLNNGFRMPIIGLGTFKIFGHDDHFKAIDAALHAGYRLIDTAQVYKNEGYIGEALQMLLEKHQVNRDNLFVTTKIAPYNQGFEKAIESVKESLSKLRLSYLDLVLIHWPGAKGLKPDDGRLSEIRRDTWRGLETCVQSGLVRSIGVSNYTIKHLDELFSYATIQPSVLQSEFHPYLCQYELLSKCSQHGVAFQAYSSLGTSDKNLSNELLDNDVIKQMAKKYSKTVQQILLRWSIQQNIGVIPKSGNPSHISENFQVFDFFIEDEDMNSMKALHKNQHLCWNPETIA